MGDKLITVRPLIHMCTAAAAVTGNAHRAYVVSTHPYNQRDHNDYNQRDKRRVGSCRCMHR